MGDPWTVDPRLNDDDPLPDYPRGGQLDEDVPDEAKLQVTESAEDLDALLRQMPPTNSDLRRRWQEEGLFDDEPSAGSSQDDGPAGDDEGPVRR